MEQAKDSVSSANAKSAHASLQSGGFQWTSPLILALVGVLGTGIGASLTGYWNAQLERQKFESSLIRKALEDATPNEAAKSLKFLVGIGALNSLDRNEIDKIADKPERLPVFLGAALRDGLTTIPRVKKLLRHLEIYKGALDDRAEPEFRVAVMRFQTRNRLAVDGLIGSKTFFAMWNACVPCPGMLKNDPQSLEAN